MTIRRTVFAAATAAMILPGAATMAQEQEPTFACEGGLDQKEIQERAGGNFAMFQILSIYRDRWLADYVREQCEAFANGKPYTITCLGDVMDWDAIEATIPGNYFGMPRNKLMPFVIEEKREGRKALAAFDYCREVGALDQAE